MNQVRLSRLETIVASYIVENWPQYILVPQARVIRRTKKTRYEIDLYLPELKLGFEVQDFATHSREATTVKNPWGKKMKDPAYHELKKSLAKAQLGVLLLELWQDEIESGSFAKIVDLALESI